MLSCRHTILSYKTESFLLRFQPNFKNFLAFLDELVYSKHFYVINNENFSSATTSLTKKDEKSFIFSQTESLPWYVFCHWILEGYEIQLQWIFQFHSFISGVGLNTRSRFLSDLSRIHCLDCTAATPVVVSPISSWRFR